MVSDEKATHDLCDAARLSIKDGPDQSSTALLVDRPSRTVLLPCIAVQVFRLYMALQVHPTIPVSTLGRTLLHVTYSEQRLVTLSRENGLSPFQNLFVQGGINRSRKRQGFGIQPGSSFSTAGPDRSISQNQKHL